MMTLTTIPEEKQLKISEFLCTLPAPVSCSDDIVAVQLNREKYPRYREIEAMLRYKTTWALLLNCSKLCHMSDLGFLKTDASELDRRIACHPQFGGLTVPEIRAALTNGACGDYGDFLSVTIKVCLNWLGAFIRENESAYREAVRRREMADRKSYDDQILENVKRKLAASMARASRERMQGINAKTSRTP